MKQAYKDILGRIAENPTWYDVHGAPRYGAPPDRMLPFMRTIACQACGARFWVAFVDEVYYSLGGELIRLLPDGPCPADRTKLHARVESGSLVSWNRERGGFDSRPLPADVDWGDPPHHGGCVGETMSSDEVGMA